jgi:protein ImuB
MELVVDANRAARAAGVRAGMAVAEARGRCAGLHLWARNVEAEEKLSARLLEEAGRISPRVQAMAPNLALIDCSSVRRLRGTAEQAGKQLVKAMAGWSVRVGTGGHATAAVLAVKSGLGRIAPGKEREAIAGLPLRVARHFLLGRSRAAHTVSRRSLEGGLRWPAGEARSARGLSKLPPDVQTVMGGLETGEALQVLDSWGVRTLGALAALDEAEVAARLGAVGVRLQQVARGEAVEWFAAATERERTLAGEEVLDPPVRDGQRIQAAVERVVERLGAELERQDRVVEHGRLQLKVERGVASVYERSFAVPTREARSLMAQLLHAIEVQPPRGAVERVELELRLARTRRVQGHLFATAAVETEKTARLLERLGAIWPGEAGTARPVETHRVGTFEMRAFEPANEDTEEAAAPGARLALRRWRLPRRWVPGTGEVVQRAGPWRSEGGWWREGKERWSEDEWDVEIRFADQRQSGLYRLRHDWEEGGWFITGQYD